MLAIVIVWLVITAVGFSMAVWSTIDAYWDMRRFHSSKLMAVVFRSSLFMLALHGEFVSAAIVGMSSDAPPVYFVAGRIFSSVVATAWALLGRRWRGQLSSGHFINGNGGSEH